MRSSFYPFLAFFLFVQILNAQIACDNRCLDYDGINDYIQSASPFTGNAPMTIEMWFKTENSTTGTCNNTSLANFRWLFGWEDNQFGMGDCNGNLRVVYKPLCPLGTGLCSSLPALPINDGNWHHMAFTKGGGGLRIFFDGAYYTNFSEGTYDLAGTFRIGSSGTGTVGRNWEGLIDEVRVWNYKRSDSEVAESYQCELDGNEPGLITYYNLNQGVPEGNNPGETTSIDLTTTNNDGLLNGFALAGSSSNWVCSETGANDPCPSVCSSICQVDSLIINTGYNPFTGTNINPGDGDPFWDLVQVPPNASWSVPRDAFVITNNQHWNTSLPSEYISGQPVPNYSPDNCPADDCSCPPYLFKRCFCICEDDSVTIKFDVLHDDLLQINLVNQVTNVSTNIYNGCPQQPAGNYYFQTVRHVETTLFLESGNYCLEAELFNTGGVAMGFSLAGAIFGASLESDFCCSPNGSIVGSKYRDLNCDGKRAISTSGTAFIDPSEPDWEIVLCDENGTPITSTTTDQQGIYSFNGLSPGNYIVKETMQTGWLPSAPPGGSIMVTVEANSSVLVDFGNCKEPCGFAVGFDFDLGNCGEVFFINNSLAGAGVTYCWDFNGDNICDSSNANPDYQFPVSGSHPVCLTVDNGDCDETICLEVNVQFDDRPPTLDCPDDVVIFGDDLNCEATYFLQNPLVDDNMCATFANIVCTRSDGLPVGDPYFKGVTSVICIAENDFGKNTCSWNVTVEDITPPQAVCQLAISVQLDNNCTAVLAPADVDNGSFDNCQIVNMTLDQNVFSNCGQFMVTLSVEDCGGNISSCISQVNAVDNVPPIITCPADVMVDCDANVPPVPPATAIDNCTSVPNIIISFLDVVLGNIPCDGEVQRIWRAIDECGNMANCLQSILVVDNVLPELTCPPNFTVNTDVGECYFSGTLPQVLATDNCDPNPSATCFLEDNMTLFPITPFFQFPKGANLIRCIAEDACGNQNGACTYTLSVVDNEPPVILNCPADVVVNLPIGSTSGPVSWPPPTVFDNCPMAVLNCSHSPGDIFDCDTTQVICTATDMEGNTATCQFNVIVNCGLQSMFECGQSVITCFSGFTSNPPVNDPGNPAKVADDFVLAMIDFRDHSSAPMNPSLAWTGTGSPHPLYHHPSWKSSNVGQLFGLAIDDNNNVYTTTSTIHGQMPPGGLPGAGPGTVYKIDNATGQISVWANLPNSLTANGNVESGLGNICFDTDHQRLFVSNFLDGKIYSLDLSGNILEVYDPPLHDPAVNGQGFHHPSITTGYEPLGQRIWGIGYHQGTLYFAVWGRHSQLPSGLIRDNEIWSVNLTGTGDFPGGTNVNGNKFDAANLEICLTCPGPYSAQYSLFSHSPVSDIAFTCQDEILLGSKTMDYNNASQTGDQNHWSPGYKFAHYGIVRKLPIANFNAAPVSYYVGNHGGSNNCSGGIDVGYGTFDPTSQPGPDVCDQKLWSTGDALIYHPSAPVNLVYGIAGIDLTGNSPGTASQTSIYIDVNDDPSTAGKTFYGDIEIFKCGCCTSPAIDCDSLMVMVDSISMPDDSTCCYSIDIKNNVGPDITQLCVELSNTPDWIINISTINVPGFSWVATTSNQICIENPNGIPSGTTNDVFEFCLTELDLSAIDTQCLVFSWYEGKNQSVCTDTVKTYCSPPTIKDTCFIIDSIVAECQPDNDYAYCVTFNVTNISAFPATGFTLFNLPPGYSFGDCGCGGSIFAGTDYNFDWFSNPLASGDTRAVCVELTSYLPILNPIQLYFNGSVQSATTCCKSPDDICVPLAPCCEPCEGMTVQVDNNSSIPDSCCFNLDFNYDCDYLYFTKIDFKIITPGVIFGSHSIGSSDWGSCGIPEPDSVCIEPFAGIVAPGFYDDLFQFCLSNIDNASQIPQEVKVTFWTLDQAGRDSVACDTILKFDCAIMDEPGPCTFITNERIECIPDSSKYRVTVDVQNISNPSFTADGILIQPTGSITPNPIYFPNPLSNDGSIETISFCYTPATFPDPDNELVLIYKLFEGNYHNCCNGNETVYDTLTLPPCQASSCACPDPAMTGPELVVNGNFESGLVGFTSDYSLLSSVCSPGRYNVANASTVVPMCNNWTGIDHTTGSPTGLFFVCDGHQTPGQAAWREQFNVVASADYNLCAFVNNLNEPGFDRTDPVVEVWIVDALGNQTLLGTAAPPESPDVWVQITGSWTAPSVLNNPYSLEFRTSSNSFEGNNFAIDDISFRQCAQGPPPIDPCDSLDFAWSFDNSQPPLGDCCWKVSLEQMFNDISVKSVVLDNVVGADINVIANGGWTVNQSGNHAEILFPGGGPIPQGTYTNQFVVCFENIVSLPQSVDLFWNIVDPGNPDSCVLVCPETIFSDCPIDDVDPCCQDFDDFCNRVNDGFTWSVDPDSCKLTIKPTNFTDCMEVTEWIWGDGSNGGQPNADGSYCHYYGQGGNFSVCFLAVERDENGNICWEKEYCEQIMVDCPDTCSLDTFFIRTGHNYSTGGALTGNGTSDPNWTVNGVPIITKGNLPTSYINALPATRWVNPVSTTNDTYKNWNLDFDFCLSDMPYDCSELSLVLNIRADNQIVDIRLNGVTLPGTFPIGNNSFNDANPTQFVFNPTVNDCGIFNLGTNLLTVTLRNLIGTYGINIDGYITSSGATPIVADIDCCDPAPTCPCESLQADVNKGISEPLYNIKTCYGGVRPLGLTECDSIVWTLDNVPVGSTQGPFQYISLNFQTGGSHTICMQVFRQQPNGVPCGPITTCKTVTVNCNGTFPWPCADDAVLANPGFDEGAGEGPLSGLMGFEGWEVAFGEPYVKNEPGFANDAYILLSGNALESDGIQQRIAHTQGNEFNMTMALNFSEWDDLQGDSNHTTRIVVRLSDNEQTGSTNNGPVLTSALCCIIGDTIWPISFPSVDWDDEIFLTIHVENDFDVADDAGASKSVVSLDNVCFDMPVDVNEPDFVQYLKIFPNPTTSGLNIEFTEPTTSDLDIEILDIVGRRVMDDLLPTGNTRHQLDLDGLPSAVYLIKLTDKDGQTWHSKFVKQ